MTQTALPIQAPSTLILEALSQVVDDGLVKSGPIMVFDPARRCFLIAVVDQGIVMHWQLESCKDQVEADALKQRYSGFVREALYGLEPLARAELERTRLHGPQSLQ